VRFVQLSLICLLHQHIESGFVIKAVLRRKTLMFKYFMQQTHRMLAKAHDQIYDSHNSSQVYKMRAIKRVKINKGNEKETAKYR